MDEARRRKTGCGTMRFWLSATAFVICSVLASQAMASHSCEEGDYRLDEIGLSVDPPTSCLGLEVLGEMRGCEHARLRIDNQCESFVKMLDGTPTTCELGGPEPTGCQVIASGLVGYVDLPWRKVVSTEGRQEHRFDAQVEGQPTFIYVSFDSTRLDVDAEEDGAEGDQGGGGCHASGEGSPAPVAFSVVALLGLGLLIRRVGQGPS